MPEVAGQVNDGHAAAAQLALEHVPIPQHLLEAVAWLGVVHLGSLVIRLNPSFASATYGCSSGSARRHTSATYW